MGFFNRVFRKRVAEERPNYSVVSDKYGITGLWLSDPENAKPGVIGVLLTRENEAGKCKVPVEWFGAVVRRAYRVVPNAFDKAGGVFVMFRGPAPGSIDADPAQRQAEGGTSADHVGVGVAGGHKDQQSLDALCAIALDLDAQDEARKAAWNTLTERGELITAFAKGLKHPNPDIRRAMAVNLRHTGDARAIAPLAEALNDEDPVVRENARESLESLGASPEEKAGSTVPKSPPAPLPEITDANLQKEHGPFGSSKGEGGKLFEEAGGLWNRDEYDSARDMLERALAAGLTMPYESYAQSILGQIWIEKGDLGRAVSHFLKCLEVPFRNSDALWMSAIRLHLIYDGSGRKREADTLRALAAAADTRGLSLSADGESKIRSLVHRM